MKTLTDAQVKAARERVARWEMVIHARHVRMTSSDASCGTDAIIDREPRTVNELFHGGVGPYSRVQFATCQTRGADSSRDVDAQTEDTEGRAVQTQCPEDLVASRDVLEAGSSGKGGGSRRKMAASRAARTCGGAAAPPLSKGNGVRTIQIRFHRIAASTASKKIVYLPLEMAIPSPI